MKNKSESCRNLDVMLNVNMSWVNSLCLSLCILPSIYPSIPPSIHVPSTLPAEPLYQTYRETVITKAIRQATVCRNISKTSVDFQMDYGHRRGSGASAIGGVSGGALSSRASPIPEAGQSTLWRDLPAVRESRILETLTSDQCKYQEVRRVEGKGEGGDEEDGRERGSGRRQDESELESEFFQLPKFFLHKQTTKQSTKTWS